MMLIIKWVFPDFDLRENQLFFFFFLEPTLYHNTLAIYLELEEYRAAFKLPLFFREHSSQTVYSARI